MGSITWHKPSRPESSRPTAADRGYDSVWRRFRKWFLSLHPLCEDCQDDGRYTVATEVDHVNPLANGGERLNPDNCRALCKSCHSRKTVKYDGSFRGRGNV